MKKTMSLALCVAVIMFSVISCSKKKKDTTTPSPDCSGLAVTATVTGTTATPTTTGGTSPYQYSLDGTSYVTETQVAGLHSGSNTIYVKDANSCTATTTVTANSSPTAVVTYPTNNLGILLCCHTDTTMVIAATATDSDGTVSKVEFYVDDTKIGEDLSSPYTYSFDFTTNVYHYVKVVSTDNQGATTTSAVNKVTIVY